LFSILLLLLLLLLHFLPLLLLFFFLRTLSYWACYDDRADRAQEGLLLLLHPHPHHLFSGYPLTDPKHIYFHCISIENGAVQ